MPAKLLHILLTAAASCCSPLTTCRQHLPLEDGGRQEAAPRPGGYPGYPSAGTPMAAGGRTPMHPGINATPMHYSQHATPLHPGMTPAREALTKTPGYDPAWAATPAHPGFGGARCCPAALLPSQSLTPVALHD